MPTIPNYKLENDDLNTMDDLLLAKRKMLNKMKIEEAEVKFDKLKNVDGKLIISNFDSATKLLKSTNELYKKFDNRLIEDRYKMVKGVNTRLSSVINESDQTITELFDTIDKINSNLKILYDTIYDLIPFSRYIDSKKIKEFYKTNGYFMNLFNTTGTDKILGGVFYLTNNIKFTINDFLDKYATLNNSYDNFIRVWKQLLKQYEGLEKVSVK